MAMQTGNPELPMPFETFFKAIEDAPRGSVFDLLSCVGNGDLEAAQYEDLPDMPPWL